MAVTINVLNAGSITLGSSGSTPSARTATRVWYGDDENVYTDYEIETILGGTYDDTTGFTPTATIPNVTSAKKIEIGMAVTSIGGGAFASIGLTNLTFVGKDRSTVQAMDNYPFGLDNSNSTIHCTDGDIEFHYDP